MTDDEVGMNIKKPAAPPKRDDRGPSLTAVAGQETEALARRRDAAGARRAADHGAHGGLAVAAGGVVIAAGVAGAEGDERDFGAIAVELRAVDTHRLHSFLWFVV